MPIFSIFVFFYLTSYLWKAFFAETLEMVKTVFGATETDIFRGAVYGFAERWKAEYISPIGR